MEHITDQLKTITNSIDVISNYSNKKTWKSGQTFALLTLFILGCFLIFVGIYLITDDKLSTLITSFGLTIGPSAGIAQLYRVFLFGEIKIELAKPIEQLKGILEIISDLGEQVKPLKDEVSILHQATENGLINIYPKRADAIRYFQSAIDSESEEIMIIGSSLKGLLQDKDYTWLNEKLLHKIEFKVKVLFMLTHPCVADLRGRLEDRDPTFIGDEIIKSIKLLRDMKVPCKNVRLYKGTPTIFGIKTKEKMIINPYPYKSQAMTSPCFELIADKRLFDCYSEKHFGAWDSTVCERITDYGATIDELENNLNNYHLNIDKVLNI